ncbi:UBA domain-containing protein 7 [Candida viswanathii]|uniref:UBA domain-containing protein 7 n=1 Tax=Candida viswanathii TaxID=5486 RepID=A0A367YJB6_9ASCO|nr:UBA domain-containing protein 7 [Candida viswanathii]
MVPPKKDAFADLFQSASRGTSNANVNSKLNNLSLSERQKLQEKSNQLYSQPESVNSSWSNIDILTPSRQPSPAGSTKPTREHSSNNVTRSSTTSNNINANGNDDDDDPFAIFQSKDNVTTTEKSNRNQLGEISLLDDEFTDVFPDAPKQTQTADVSFSSQPSASLGQPKQPSQRARAKQPPPPAPTSRSSRSTLQRKQGEQRDQIVAELMDIGFDIDQSNEAIDTVGPDVQKCVNYIMNKSAGTQDDNAVLGHIPDPLNLNEIGSDLFKKANSFINFSKRTVMKNLEHLNGPKNNNLPEWMRNQAKYKSEGVDKNQGGEDYGTDEENINQEEIERFMRQQRERQRERYNRPASPAVPLPRSDSSRSESPAPPLPRRPQVDQTPALPRRPQVPKRSTTGTAPTPNGKSLKNRSVQSLPVGVAAALAAPASEAAPSVDLLGLETGSLSKGSSAPSSIRDSSPLNQFVQTDYSTAKERATASFKSGDYTLALESYSLCLSLLPPSHELRVVILSNLATVNKLLGHLRDSLGNIDEAQKLIGPEEIASEQYTISDKTIKYWSIKLLAVRAEVLELLEKYEESLDLYLLLIQKFNCNDKKFMDGKRRVDKIVNPQNYSRPKPSKSSSPAPVKSETPTSSKKPKASKIDDDEIDPFVRDNINQRIQSWAQSKQNNLRSMLTNLNEIIPSTVAMNDKSRNLTLNDLMLPKQVKIQYMKVISSIHPDKLASQPKELQLVCTGVFIILNKAWEEFKESS